MTARFRVGRACFVLPLALAACSLGPDYARPSLDVPAAWRATQASAAQAWPAPGWWRAFGSADLDRLIATARVDNQNLAAAAARVRQADAAVRIAGAPLLPSIGATGTGSYQRVGTAQRSGVVRAGGSRYIDVRSYALELNASYELDFWGKNRAAYQSAQASALASRFDQQTVALTVVTSIASTYFQALALQDRLAVAQANLKDAETVLRAYQAQVAAGTATALDVAQEEALVQGLRTNIPNLQNQLQQQVIGLGILVGLPPEAIHLPKGSLTRLPYPVVSAGLPSQLLARRPDVAEAEAQLVAQNGNVRVARADFFPSITLTGAGGVTSAALSTLFGPGSTLLSLASSVSQTIFDNGAKSGALAQAKGRYDELVADYRQAVLQAFTDVEDALTAVRYTTEQENLQRQAVAAAQRASDIARAQMQAGTTNIITALNTQTTLYNDQDQLVQIRLARFLALINLYKALGGGWSLPGAGAAA